MKINKAIQGMVKELSARFNPALESIVIKNNKFFICNAYSLIEIEKIKKDKIIEWFFAIHKDDILSFNLKKDEEIEIEKEGNKITLIQKVLNKTTKIETKIIDKNIPDVEKFFIENEEIALEVKSFDTDFLVDILSWINSLWIKKVSISISYDKMLISWISEKYKIRWLVIETRI